MPFGKYVFEHEAFRSGKFDTHFVKKYYSAEVLKKQTETAEKLAAIIAVKKYMEDQKLVRLPNK